MRVMAAELRRLPRQLAGRWWATALNLVALGLVAGFVPWLVGLSFLDALVVIPFACLSVFFVAILIAGSLAGDAGRAGVRELRAAGVADRGIVVGKTLAASLAGWALGMTILAAALGTVNALNWHGALLLPPTEILAAAAALSLAASVLVAGGGVLVSLGASSVAAARRTLRWSLMLVMVVCIYAVKRIPGAAGDLTTEGIARKAWIAAVVCAGLAVLLLVRATRKLSAQ